MMEKEIKAGDTVNAYGFEWEVLDKDFNGGILCLMKIAIRQMQFSQNKAYYPDSDICEYLRELTGVLEERGASFKTIELNMTATDGTGWDIEKFKAKGLFLLTERLYQVYRQYISNRKCSWWLATEYTYTYSPVIPEYVMFVGENGTLTYFHPLSEGVGVIPACVFSFLPEEEESEPEGASIPKLVESVKQLVRDNKAIRDRLKSIEDKLNGLEN